MAWSYRRRIKIIPGIHLNLSKSGITTSVGVRGASVTFGKNGTYINTSIPGLGLYERKKVSTNNPSFSENVNEQFIQDIEDNDNIFSVDVESIVSQDMKGIKDAFFLARTQRSELNKDLVEIKQSLLLSHLKLIFGYIFIIGLIKKEFSINIKADIQAKKSAIEQLTKQIESCYVNLDVDFDPDIKAKYDRVVNAFKLVCKSNKIWDVTKAQFEDRKISRSAASTVVKKREVRFDIKPLVEIKSRYEPLWLKNANGADLYFYPNFIVMYSSQQKFALLSLNELSFSHTPVHFVETGIIPNDTRIIDKTWAKVNKSGSPDKRFKGNYQIPIVKYGQINLRSDSGINEEYEFSNYEYSEQFASAFLDFQNTIKQLKVSAQEKCYPN